MKQIREHLENARDAIQATDEAPDFTLDDMGTATTTCFLVAMACRAHRMTGTLEEENARVERFVDDLGHLVADFLGADCEAEWPNLIER